MIKRVIKSYTRESHIFAIIILAIATRVNHEVPGKILLLIVDGVGSCI